MAEFDRLWDEIATLGRDRSSGGYRRFAWTAEDAALREWFAGAAAALGLAVVRDRAGNDWAWWGDPDAEPGVVAGSHLDSVPDGGAFDGPLGVVSAFAAVAALRERGAQPARPIGVALFGDEEGARFGIACAGSRLLTGALLPERFLALRDDGGTTAADAVARAGIPPGTVGPDPDALRRVGAFVEVHVEQGRGLADLHRPVALGTAIRPHGRWRVDLPGRADHAGTTRLADRADPTLALAEVISGARAAAERHGALATCGKIRLVPNGVNAIPSQATVWLDARAPDAAAVRRVVADVERIAAAAGGTVSCESQTDRTAFSGSLTDRIAAALPDAPRLETGAGHDAGVLAAAGVDAAMLFVRNPTGVSHAPDEYAEREDCLAGVAALTEVLARLSASGPPSPDRGA